MVAPAKEPGLVRAGVLWVERSVTGVLHGRDVERARLAALLDEARNGRAGILLVHGEPGAGKSALLDDLESHDYQMALLALPLSTDGSQTINYSCSAYDNGFNFMKFCDQQWGGSLGCLVTRTDPCPAESHDEVGAGGERLRQGFLH